MKILKFCLLFCLICLTSCKQIDLTSSLNSDRSLPILNATSSNLMEIAAPETIKELDRQLKQYSPQVKIISPQTEQVFNQTEINVQLEVEDLPVFRDEKLKLGNHLNLILDNEPSKPIYDLTKPTKLENLAPGTHTIRVLASRPWGESFKNDGAYAQTTFSVLAKTNDNRPDLNLPLLTYNNPTGTYGAEPFLLDFYLTNAPLHAVAQNNPNILDWRIKATINGESFLLEDWQAVYLKGLNEGENWIQLELVDQIGNDIENVYNNTVRVINYAPQQNDTLSLLMTDKMSLVDARSLIEQNDYIQSVSTPETLEPTLEIEEPKKPTVIEPAIEPVEEPTIKDNTSTEMSALKTQELVELQNDDSNSIGDRSIQAEPLPPIATPIEIEEAVKTNNDKTNNDDSAITTSQIKSEIVKSTKPKQNITITEENSDTVESIAEIAIPEPESIAITEDEIAIVIPQTDSDSISESETDRVPVWWNKILVRLRQKLEGFVKLLPNEV